MAEEKSEIPSGQRLDMKHAGADWLRRNLKAAAEQGRTVRDRRTHRRRAVTSEVSPLGVTVADVLGFVYRGLYHLDWPALAGVEWANPYCIEVPVRPGVSTVDYNELTQLVVISHDLGLRLSVDPHGPRMLRLMFHQRRARSGSLANRCPTLEAHAGLIRSGYTVRAEPREGGE